MSSRLSLRLFASLGLLALSLAVLSAAGCRSRPAGAAWKITLQTVPANPAVLDDTQFRLRLANPDGSPVDGASVTLDLAMATMDMGPNRVLLLPQARGLYIGTGHFTMGGDWKCAATVKLGARTQIQVFRYKVS